MNDETRGVRPKRADVSTSAAIRTPIRNVESSHPQPQIPDHTLLRRIGKGAYGEVWLARNVMGTYRAVKIVYRDTFQSEKPYEREFAGIQKFEPLSRSHEGMVDILQIGRDDRAGYFYYVMELADDQSTGQPIDTSNQDHYQPKTVKSETTAQGRLSFEECLQLCLSLASAVGHLHKHGLIHRDIKPSNIIFVNTIPKLADIGLVADVDATFSFVGTEGFYPPEGPGTIQADLYSLGKVLYEITTGKDRQAYPEPPTDLGRYGNQEGFLELNEITLKACAKEPSKRYQSAEQMGEDLVLLQSGKSVKRLRAMERYLALAIRVGSATALVALLASGTYLYQARQTRVVKKLAEKNLVLAKENMALAKATRERLSQWNVASGLRLLEQGDSLSALPWFAEALKVDAGDPDREAVHRVRLGALLGQAPRLVKCWGQNDAQDLLESVPRDVTSVEFSLDRRKIAFTGWQRTVRVMDVATGKMSPPFSLGILLSHSAFDPEGKRVATCGDDGRVRIWNSETAKLMLAPIVAGFSLRFCEFSPDGRRIIAAGMDRGVKEGHARIWDAATGQVISPILKHTEDIALARFSPDGKYVITASGSGNDEKNNGDARVWDASTGEPMTPLLSQGAPVWSACFSPDSARVATGSGNFKDGFSGEARVWNVRTGEPLSPSIKPGTAVLDIKFSPDGSRLLTRGVNSVVKIWNSETGELIAQPEEEYAPKGGVQEASFNPDGFSFVTVSGDSIVRVWDSVTGKPVTPPLRNSEPPIAAEFDSAGRYLITVTKSAVCVWDLVERSELGPAFEEEGELNHARFSPDGTRIVTAGRSTARPLNAMTGEPLTPNLNHRGMVIDAVFSPDGTRVAACDTSGQAKVWNAKTGDAIGQPMTHSNYVWTVSFSPDGAHVLTGSWDGTARVWDASTGDPVSPPLRHNKRILCAEFSPDGRRVATASEDETARIWDAATGQPLTPPMSASGADVHFNQNGLKVVTSSKEDAFVWDANSGQKIGSGLKHSAVVYYAVFSPDSRLVATSCADQTAHVWDLSTGRELCPPVTHGASVAAAVSFSPDSRLLLTVAQPQGFVRLWDVRTGDLVASVTRAGKYLKGEFSPDGSKIVISGHGDGAQILNINADRRSVADIVQVSQLFSARQVGAGGALIPLETNGWFTIWAKVRPNSPRESTKEELVNWHANRAAPLLKSRQWTALNFHASKLIELKPTDWDTERRIGWLWKPWDLLGFAHMKLLQFRLAAHEFEKAIEMQTWSNQPGFNLAFCRLAIGDMEGYRKARDGFIERYGGPGAVRIGWLAPFLCSLFPEGPIDFKHLVELGEKEVSDPSQRGGSIGLWIFDVGRAYYRAGQYEKAIDTLTKALPQMAEEDPLVVYPFLAMAHQKLGHTDEAKLWLGKARRALDTALFGDKRSAEFRRGSVIASVYLCHEAENLTAGVAYAPPTPAELLAVWQKFSGKLPVEYRALSTEALDWHRREAETAEKGKEWFAAVFHLERLMETEIADPTVRLRLESARNEISKLPAIPMDTVCEEPLIKLDIPPRDPAARASQIDLSRFYNASLTSSWHGLMTYANDLSSLPRGLQTLAGIEFDVRGIVQLRTANFPLGPKEVKAIPMALSCRRVHFLHAATVSWEIADGVELGKYIFHFTDGRQELMPICQGFDVRDWWASQEEPYESKRSVVAWRGTNGEAASRGVTIRLFKSTWENPHAEATLKSIDYVSSGADGGPFLIAITAE